MRIRFIITSLILFTTLISINAQLEDSSKKWHFLIEPYLTFPNMDGETGVGENLIVPVDASPGDVFNHLQMGAMLSLEARTDRWSINSEFVYMNLNQEVTPGVVLYSGTLEVKQFIWECSGLYRVMPFLELGVGGRLNNLEMGVDGRKNALPAGTYEFETSAYKTWYDPIVITRLSKEINNKWLFQLRGDVGGFEIGSELTWQLQAYAGYRFTKVFQMTAGYRFLSTDFESGEEPKEFVFDLNEFGPTVRFGFNF